MITYRTQSLPSARNFPVCVSYTADLELHIVNVCNLCYIVEFRGKKWIFFFT